MQEAPVGGNEFTSCSLPEALSPTTDIDSRGHLECGLFDLSLPLGRECAELVKGVHNGRKQKRKALGQHTSAPLVFSLIFRVPQGSPPYSTGTSQPQFKKHFACRQSLMFGHA